MIISNNKQNCIYDLSNSIQRSEKWRRQLEVKYHDPRNGRAAERLNQLAAEISDLTDDQYSELKPFYSWSSPTWSEAVSATSRLVEFRNVRTLSEFLSSLVGILSQSGVAA
jgi:hypothetical protein